MDIRRSVISGLRWTGGARVASQVMTWVITIVVMRLLAPEDYGLMAMAAFFMSLAAMISELGLGAAVVQAPKLDHGALRQVFGAVLVLNALLFGLLFAFATPIAAFFQEDRLDLIVRVLAVEFLLVPFATVPDALLRRAMRLKACAVIEFSTTVISSLCTLGAAAAGAGIWALVLGYLVKALLRIVFLNAVQPFFHLPSFGFRENRKMLGFGGNIVLSRLLWFFYSQCDVLIAGRVLGKEALGFYSVGLQIASLPVQRLSSIVNQVGFSAFSRIQDEGERVRAYFLLAVRTVSLVTFPILWGIGAVAPVLVPALLGEKWHGAILPLQAMSLIMPIRMISVVLPAATDGVGRADISVQNLALCAIVTPLALVVGSQWGLTGMCVAWIVASPPLAMVTMLRGIKVIGVRPRELLEPLVAPGCAAGIMWAVVGIAIYFLQDSFLNSRVLLLFLISIGATVYIALTFLVNRNALREASRLLFDR